MSSVTNDSSRTSKNDAATYDAFEQDVLDWLSAVPQKFSVLKYLYDEEGGHMFEDVCRSPGYYVFRTEKALLTSKAAEISACIPAGAALVEYGSGYSEKTRILLDAAPQLSTYVPIEINATALEEAAEAISADYPFLQVKPLQGDYTQSLELPRLPRNAAKVGFFLGATIGGMEDDKAKTFLRSARALLGEGAEFLVGIDVVKDEETMLQAYNDPAGLMRRHKLNLLTRINRRLGGDFALSKFDYEAVWNEDKGRVEGFLVSLCDQTVHVSGREFRFARGQRLNTLISNKYTLDRFDAILSDAEWKVQRRWINDKPKYALYLLKA